MCVYLFGCLMVFNTFRCLYYTLELNVGFFLLTSMTLYTTISALFNYAMNVTRWTCVRFFLGVLGARWNIGRWTNKLLRSFIRYGFDEHCYKL